MKGIRSLTIALLRRLYRGLAYPDSPACHVVLEPLLETGALHTRLFLLLDRITDSFRLAGLDAPATIDVTFTVYDAHGHEVHRERLVRHPIERLFVWESETRIPARARPVEGTIAVEGILYDRQGRRMEEDAIQAVWRDKFAGIVEFFIDYYDENRFITTTHANMPVKTPPSPLRRTIARTLERAADTPVLRPFRTPSYVRPGTISVFSDGSFESSLIYYTWLEGTTSRQLWAELRNADGGVRRAPLPALPPRSFCRLRISELFPGSREFLGGQTGNLLLDRAVPLLTCDPRFYLQTVGPTRDGFGIDHAYLEHTTSPGYTSTETWRSLGKGYHSPCVVIERPGTRTALVLFNMVEVERPKRIGVLLYDVKGNLIVDKRPVADLPPRAVRTVWIRDLLDEVEYRGDFVGHAEIFYSMDAEPVPDMLHHQVLYVQREHVEGVQHAVGLWNSPRRGTPAGVKDPQDLGIRAICAPAYADERYETFLGLTNCSHAWDYDVEASITLSLKIDDRVVESRDITIPPNGIWFDSVLAVFPDAVTQLEPYGGKGLIGVRPLNIRTLGAQFFHVVRATGEFSSEHTL